MLYTSDDNQYSVEVNEEIIKSIIQHITPAGRKETGGILIGHYTGSKDCAIIEQATPAPPDSKSGYTWFERGIKDLQPLITRLWKEKQYYIGEWHFHPNASPTPSGTDIKQMVKIASSVQYNCPEPILLIIGGNPENFEIRTFIVLANKKIIEAFTKSFILL